jgi:hypothetical protein
MRHALKGRPARLARITLGLIAPAALVAAGTGPALAASSTATGIAGSTACTDNWVGKAVTPQWTIAKNWSAGVPAANSDVCIGTGVDVLTGVSISVHSLRLGRDAGIALEGTPASPVSATVATFVDLTPGGISRIDLTDATINAAQISDQGGTIFTDGTCNLTSPDVVFGHGGSLQAANGTTTLTGLPQLSNGTLTGASIHTALATVVLPGDVASLVASNIGVGARSEIRDAAGHNALAGLTSIDPASSLSLASKLALTGGLMADGLVSLDGGDLALAGPFTQAQGTLQSHGTSALSASQVTIDQGATLDNAYGGSTITGNLVNEGSVFASVTDVKGSYTQAPGASLTESSGLLTVSGQATLAGSVSATEAFARPGTTFPLIRFGSLSGGFTSHSVGIVLSTKSREIDATITPQIAALPATVAPGQTVTVDGGGFHYAERVRLFLHSVAGRPLGRATAGIRGDFAATITIPSFTATGTQQIIAVGSHGDRATATITVS